MLNSRDVASAMARSYPPLLREAAIGGTIRLCLRVDPQGRVIAVDVLESSGHPALDDAARSVGWGILFEPTLIDGLPSP